MITGIKIQMGGQEWQVPPLTLGQLRRLQPLIAQLTSGETLQVMEAVCELVSAALSRNYPMVEVEETSSYEPKFTANGVTRTPMSAAYVENLIDLGNRASVIDAVMGGSGLQLGEASAVTGNSGEQSMDSSPPRADTAIQ